MHFQFKPPIPQVQSGRAPRRLPTPPPQHRPQRRRALQGHLPRQAEGQHQVQRERQKSAGRT